MSAPNGTAQDIEPLILSLRGVHALANYPMDETPPEALLNSAYGFYHLIHSRPDNFRLATNAYQRNFAPETLDTASLQAIARLPDNWRYGAAVAMSMAHIESNNCPQALAYSPHLLVPERDVPLNQATTVTNVSQYDRATHALPARELCYFALLHDIQTLQLGSLRILDLCCGSGLNSEYLIRFASHLTGLDISTAALQQSGRGKRYDHIVEGDAQETIASLAGPFDLIICTGALYFFRDLSWLFEHSKRLLAPGGQLVANAFPADDSADCQVTRWGNHRYCHSARYLEHTANAHELLLADRSWTTAYGLPYWLLRFTPRAINLEASVERYLPAGNPDET